MPKSNKKSKKKDFSFKNLKEQKLFENLLKVTEQLVCGKNYKPMTENQFMQKLSLPDQHQEIFQNVLKQLLDEHVLTEKDGLYLIVQEVQPDSVKGIIRMHPRGFGFVQVEQPSNYVDDIFIPKHFTKNAIDGDHVEILVNPEISEKGPEGKILNILGRARTHLAGIVKAISNGETLVYSPMLGPQQKIIVQSTKKQKLEIGDRIVMEVIEWGAKNTETVCKMSRYLGHISDPSCDIKAAIEEFELRSTFPVEAVEEAHQYGKQVGLKDIKQREDLRELTSFTIDPDTAKDFDDALSLRKDEKGFYHLGVHIADVSHYVKPNTALDLEAQARCNSTYFPNTCIPMLPKDLSENLCSLKPNVNRLTVSVLIVLDPTGTVTSYRITRSVIKSAKRFTYREAKAVLDNEKKSIHAPTLHLMAELCGLLKKKRYQRGSIEFSLPELVIKVNEQGVPFGTDYVSYDITHQMVEEFMLKANELVAQDLASKGKNLTYRIHDVPAEENLRDFAILASAFGFKIPDFPEPSDLQKLFEDAEGSEYSNYLASNYIRRMRLAAYSPENIGHYGLSLEHYCHFTSPIRRYVDLVVHRILFGESDDFEYLQQICNNCSEQERISAKAESSVLILKKLRLLNSIKQEDPHKEYEAIITRVKNFGVYFEIIDFLFEGFVHISELGNDYYVFEEEHMRLKGSRRGEIFRPGEKLTVMLKDIDFILQEASWYIVSVEENPQALNVPKKRSSKKTSGKSSSEKKKSRKQKAVSKKAPIKRKTKRNK